MSIWRRLNSPLSDRGFDIFAVVGLLAFGLSGFIDMTLGLGFPWLKRVFLVLGIIAAVRMFKERQGFRDDQS